VATQYKKALQDVDSAWRNRPVVEASAKEPEPEPILEPTVKPEDPNETALLEALDKGSLAFRPVGQTPVTVPGNELLAAAEPVRKGFRVMDLQMAPKAAQDYLASVDAFWKKALQFKGEFSLRVQDQAWRVIHGQLAKLAEGTLKGEMLTRTPAQQAKVRREYLKLLTSIDEITSRVAACPEQDVLRARVSLYFEPGFYNDALIDTRVGADEQLETRIPWVKDKFDKMHLKRAIRAGGKQAN
jgi:hypothetical protein